MATITVPDFGRFLEFFVAGAAVGGIYALMGMGVTVVYKATRVPNFAFAAMGTVTAVVHWDLITEGGVVAKGGGLNYWLGLVLALAFAAALGAVTEFLVRPLQGGRVLAALVLTLGWMFFLLAGINAVWGFEAKYMPPMWAGDPFKLPGFGLARQQAAILILAAVLLVGLTALFKYTKFGLAVRAVAEDREAARMMGIDIDRTSRMAWMLGSVLSGLTVILVIPPALANTYQPTIFLVFAFGAALMGGFNNLIGAAIGGLILGVVPALVQLNGTLQGIGGFSDFVAFAIIIGILVRRPAFIFPPGRGDVDDDAFSATERRPSPLLARAWGAVQERVPALGVFNQSADVVMATGQPWRGAKWLRRGLVLALLVYLVIWVPVTYADFEMNFWALGISVFLAALSLVVLSGWTGQIPLSQAAFFGLGAYLLNLYAVRFGLPHAIALPLIMVSVLPFALLIGLPSLRLKGLYFAIASIGFMLVAQSLLWGPQADWFTGGQVRIVPEDWMISIFDGRPGLSLYLLALALAVVTVWFARNIRLSRVGRAFLAVRDSEVAARSLGIDPARYKLTAFAFSGVIAALGGVVYAYMAGIIDPTRFVVFLSIQYLLYTVVGGIESIAGAGFIVYMLEIKPALDQEPATGVSAGPLLLLGLLTALVVRYEPGGLAAIGRRFQQAVTVPLLARLRDRRRGAADALVLDGELASMERDSPSRTRTEAVVGTPAGRVRRRTKVGEGVR